VWPGAGSAANLTTLLFEDESRVTSQCGGRVVFTSVTESSLLYQTHVAGSEAEVFVFDKTIS
jgi:hypothetical protein